jgi:hypothetical protein
MQRKHGNNDEFDKKRRTEGSKKEGELTICNYTQESDGQWAVDDDEAQLYPRESRFYLGHNSPCPPKFLKSNNFSSERQNTSQHPKYR